MRALGGLLVLVGVLMAVGTEWLHQPGFVGDPEARLLDGAAYGLALTASVGVGGFGLWLLSRPR